MHKFVQPLLPDFIHSFFIPKSFVKYLRSDLKGDPLETVVLMTDYLPSLHWIVTVENDRLFKDGWQEFCLHHDFQIGEFLVFTYQSNWLFHVSVYEPQTACQRIPSSCNHPKSVSKTEGSKRTRVELDTNCETEPDESEDDGEAANTSIDDDALCDINLTSYSVEKGMLFLPAGFARKNGLQFRRGEVLIKDAKKRGWPAKLNYKKRGGEPYICGGWKSFVEANLLKPGNVVSLQLLKGGNCPTFKCCRLKRTRVDLNSTCKTKPTAPEAEGEAASPSTHDDSSYIVNLTPYGFRMGVLDFPVGFLRKTGLRFRRCEAMIKDAKERIWPVKLNYRKGDGQPYISQGWKSFLTANHLKPGHAISLQFLKGGSCPIVRCCRQQKTGIELNSACKTTPKKTQAEGVTISPSDQGSSKYPICQIKLSTCAIERPYISIPARFLQECGLLRRRNDVKVVDEKERTWQASLNFRCNGNAYICRVWNDFKTANCFKLGDTICFQLLEAGEHPTLKCYKDPLLMNLHRK